MKPLIFIDGEAGTTGLQIFSRLKGRTDINFLTLEENDRKDPARRSEAINNCDLAILCLPDAAAKEAVSFVKNTSVKILDASSAHRTLEGWVYGFPEMTEGQHDLIASAKRVSNPGCYPTGAVAILRPLVEAGLIPADYPVNVHAVSGYSGSGKSLIDAYENENSLNFTQTPYRGYGLNLEHKHTSEIEKKSMLEYRPIFSPAYGKYRQGIVLYIPIHLRLLKTGVTASHLQQHLERHYQSSRFINVIEQNKIENITGVEPEILNNTNNMNIYVFHNNKHNQAILVAVYDNLGKGASGAAVQNMNIMLNLEDAISNESLAA
ncbi:MAG TPA: N-acetyl-gamma-glutamyl-phosphate reductase [Burkholderiaceae bacterium]|jgi:N-acetyl-gamma-glutamyl-phosphate reductase|nr:N-acetyl-gamma-glutamyl-phosphate reductase [Burkholderiaceae bacterium]